MSFVIDPRKNWARAEELLAEETDPRRRQILETIIKHSKSEAAADFETLMSTVAPNAHYHSYAAAEPEMNAANSPEGKAEVAAYYTGIVESGCHLLEHGVERMVVGRDQITTEGELRMAYPGAILSAMGFDVPDPDALYLYQQRLLIVWEFDQDGLVLCEDSYGAAGSVGFEGISERRIQPEEIYRVSSQDVA